VRILDAIKVKHIAYAFAAVGIALYAWLLIRYPDWRLLVYPFIPGCVMNSIAWLGRRLTVDGRDFMAGLWKQTLVVSWFAYAYSAGARALIEGKPTSVSIVGMCLPMLALWVYLHYANGPEKAQVQ